MRSVVVAACIAAATGSVCAQEIVRLPGGNWTLTLPEGWAWASGNSLNDLNKSTAKVFRNLTANAPNYVMGALKDSERPLFLLVQEGRALPADATFRQVDRAFTKDAVDEISSRIEKAYSDVTMRVVSSSADETAKTLTLVSELMGVDGILTVTSTMHFSKDRVVTLHTYAPVDAPEVDLAELRGIHAGLVIDPGQSYEFRAGRSNSVAIGAIAGGIGAAVAGAWQRKRKQAQG